MLSTLKRAAHSVRQVYREGYLKRAEDNGLSPLIGVPARAYVQRRYDTATTAVIDGVEAQRARLAAMGDTVVPIFYSPKPGTAGTTATEELRPDPGKILNFTMKQVAHTGKNAWWGAFMHMLAREAKSESILELGACAGISGAYLAASPFCKSLVTIEASSALADIAREVIENVAPGKAEVINGLFDDVLDERLEGMEDIDFLFIDGHHEKIATIHYWQRCVSKLSPGAIVVFDDISWSADMREGWLFLSKQPNFSHAYDLGSIGVCVHSPTPTVPKYWDMRAVTGVKSIGQPRGWKD